MPGFECLRPGRPGLIPILLLALAASGAQAGGSGPSAPEGAGGLLVAPTRLVFEGTRRSAELTLINTGARTATFRISFTRMRMGEHGEMLEVQTGDSLDRHADTLVRYSPRRVVLPPGIPQTVRLQLRLPAGLGAGEYRSHLLFRQVPDAVAVAAAGAEDSASDRLHLRMTPVFGVAVPVIVRHGETWAGVNLSDFQMGPAGPPGSLPVLEVALNRSGNQSVYGDLSVQLLRGGVPVETVGEARGLAVYCPNPRRGIRLPLHLPPPPLGTDAALRITYTVQGGLMTVPPATVDFAIR